MPAVRGNAKAAAIAFRIWIVRVTFLFVFVQLRFADPCALIWLVTCGYKSFVHLHGLRWSGVNLVGDVGIRTFTSLLQEASAEGSDAGQADTPYEAWPVGRKN